jgi:hypothetical protein
VVSEPTLPNNLYPQHPRDRKDWTYVEQRLSPMLSYTDNVQNAQDSALEDRLSLVSRRISHVIRCGLIGRGPVVVRVVRAPNSRLRCHGIIVSGTHNCNRRGLWEYERVKSVGAKPCAVRIAYSFATTDLVVAPLQNDVNVAEIAPLMSVLIGVISDCGTREVKPK